VSDIFLFLGLWKGGLARDLSCLFSLGKLSELQTAAVKPQCPFHKHKKFTTTHSKTSSWLTADLLWVFGASCEVRQAPPAQGESATVSRTATRFRGQPHVKCFTQSWSDSKTLSQQGPDVSHRRTHCARAAEFRYGPDACSETGISRTT